METECPVCRRETDYTAVCDECAAALEALRIDRRVFHLPDVNGKELPFAAAFAYTPLTVSFLFYLKQNDIPAAFRSAAVYCAGALARLPVSDGAVFVHVPRRHENVRTYGFDHAAMLAKACAKTAPFSAGYVPLLKRRHVKSADQKSLEKEQRGINVEGAFFVNRRMINRVNGASAIVIVDDVITTGSSVKECARVIEEVFPRIPVCALALSNASVKAVK